MYVCTYMYIRARIPANANKILNYSTSYATTY